MSLTIPIPTPNAQQDYRPAPVCGTVVGRWELTKELADTNLSQVFAARPLDAMSGSADYAVKILKQNWCHEEDAVAMFRGEALLGQYLQHPHVVSVLETHVARDPYFLVMPRLSDPSLRDRLRSEHSSRLSLSDILWVCRQVAEALAAVHDCGFRHGDVTPSNVLVSAKRHVTLLDLSASAPLGFGQPRRPQDWSGDPRYSAPETLLTAHHPDARSDLYSLGVLLYELCAGERPFAARTLFEMASAHATERPVGVQERNAEIPADVADLTHRLLAKNPLRRPQSALETINELVDLEIKYFAHR